MAGNREYKSDVFGMLMEEPEYAPEVYNALNHSDYRDSDLVEVCNLEKGISLSVHNDAAFILDMNLSVYEHESTVCPNMPLRALIYVTNILEQWVKKRNIYGKRLVKIPTPRFAVFYNGTEEQPEQYKLKLSDAYANPMEETELELLCTVYNINSGKNHKLLSECSVLRQYMIFVNYSGVPGKVPGEGSEKSGKLNADSSDYAQVYIPNGRSVDIDLDYCAREEMLVD